MEIMFYGFIKLPEGLEPLAFHLELQKLVDRLGCEVNGGLVTNPIEKLTGPGPDEPGMQGEEGVSGHYSSLF